MIKIFIKFLPVIFFLIVTIVLFWQFFFKGLHPYPGNFMLAWYEPWKTDNMTNGKITIPHKPVAHDTFRQLYPFKALGVEDIKRLKLPLWNPYNGAGQPLFATMHMGFLNPFNLINFFFSTSISWSLGVIIQPFIVGVAVYYFCRSLKISNLGSQIAGVSFMFSGFIITRTIYNDYNYAIFWTILGLMVIEKFYQGHKKAVYFLPFLIAFILFSTQPQIVAYCILLLICYWIFRFRTQKLIKILLLLLGGMGLSAIQILPTLELYLLSNLNIESSKFIIERFLLPPSHFISLFIPNYYGNVATYNYWGSGDYIESIASIGLIPCLLAFIGLTFKKFEKYDIRIFFLSAIIVSIFFSIKSPLSSIIYSLPIPILSTGIPARILVIASLSIATLAGFGVDYILAAKINRKVLKLILLFTTVPISVLFYSLALFALNTDCNNAVIHTCRTIALRNTIVEFAIYGTCLFILILGITKLNKYKKIIIISILLLISIIGIYNGQKFLPFSPISTYKPDNELITAILNKSTNQRVAGLGSAKISSNFATNYRFYDLDYYDPLYIKRYGELMAFANNQGVLKRSDIELNNNINAQIEDKIRTRLLEITSTNFLIYKNGEKIRGDIIWQNNNWILTKVAALAANYEVNDFLVIKNNQQILEAIFDENFNYKQSVILEEAPKVSRLLVSTENFYPGWKAKVNGKETKVYRANYTFRAIEIPEGKYSVEFYYEPESVRIGMYISLMSLITIFIFLKVFSNSVYFHKPHVG